MAIKSIRFGINDGDGCRSATWNCFSPLGVGKSDVYLSCRELGGSLKASLHESGNWHIAFSNDFFEDQIVDPILKEKGRFIEKWMKPPQISPGMILAYRIITPWSAVKRSYDEKSYTNICWIPVASRGRATEIDILITDYNDLISNWPGRCSMNTKFLGFMNLDSGETVCIVYREIDMPSINFPTNKVSPSFFRGRTKNDMKNEDLYMILMGNMTDGSKILIDCMCSFDEIYS